MILSWKTNFAKRILFSKGEGSVPRVITWVALLGIAFGVTTALVTLSVIGGFEKIYEKAILGFNAHLVLMHDGSDDIQTALPVIEEFKKEGITGVTPFIFREGLGVFKDGISGVVIKAVDSKTMASLYPLKYDYFSSATLETVSKDEKIPVLVGKKMMERFGPSFNKETGDFKILIPRETAKTPTLKQLSQTVRVVGTFESGLYEFDSQFMLTSLLSIRQLFNENIPYSGFELVLDEAKKASTMARQMEEKLPYSFQAVSWDELNEALFSAMQLEKSLFFVIMAVILLVASFNIMGVLVILSVKVYPQLVLFRSLGAGKNQIRHILTRTGLFVGLGGFLLGSFLAVLLLESLERFRFVRLDPKIYFVDSLPVQYSWSLWMAVFLLCMGIVFFVSWAVSHIINSKGSLVEGLSF